MLAHFEVWRLNRPLQLKVKKQLRKLVKAKTYEALPCLHRRVVQALLRRHTRAEVYLNNVIEGEHRYSLDNEVEGEILEEEREFSREYLTELKAAKAKGITLDAAAATAIEIATATAIIANNSSTEETHQDAAATTVTAEADKKADPSE